MHFVVLSSSRGTTFQAVLDRIADGSVTAKCLGLVTDKPDRGCIEKAKAAGLPFIVVEQNEEEREAYDKRVHAAIESLEKKSPHPNPQSPIPSQSTLIAALGWMHILSPWFIKHWKNRIINIHPALLPKYGGKGMFGHHVHDAVLAAHDEQSGISIHLMDEGVDTGKILLQKTCRVHASDSAATLQQRVQMLEREWYPRVLQMIELGEVKL